MISLSSGESIIGYSFFISLYIITTSVDIITGSVISKEYKRHMNQSGFLCIIKIEIICIINNSVNIRKNLFNKFFNPPLFFASLIKLKKRIMPTIIIPMAVKRNIEMENNAKYLKYEILENNPIATKIKNATSETIAVICILLKIVSM